MMPNGEGGDQATSMKSQGQTGPVVSSICISMVKNEQDIIEPFIRHNHKFFDAMIIMDHGSTDDTRSIAVNCARELGGVFVCDLHGFAYAQSEIMTAAMHFAQGAFFADFVCFLDADEFIGAPDRESFIRSLSLAENGAAIKLPWQTFLPDPQLMGKENQDPLTYMGMRRIKENPQYQKSFFRFGGGLDSAVITKQGNHSFEHADGGKISYTLNNDVVLRHFPLRSSRQTLNKAVVGWLANLARFPDAKKRTNLAYQWKRLFDLAGGEDTAISNDTLFEEAMAYAQDGTDANPYQNAIREDHGITTDRRYSSGEAADHYKTVALSIIQGHQDNKNPFAQILPARKDGNVKNTPSITNAFEDAWHWRNLFLDVAPFRYIIEKYQPKSAFDVGCGNGLYLRLAENLGVTDIKGVDGIELDATVLNSQSYEKVDLQIPYRNNNKYDVVFCLEVVEHINPKDTDIVFDTIAEHAKDLIVFSMAEPGQPGNGHINCMTIEEVLAHWESRGFYPDLIESLGIRALATMSWFRRNLLVLKRKDPMQHNQSTADYAKEALTKIGSRKYRWYAQKPGIRQVPFQEPYPQKAYGKLAP